MLIVIIKFNNHNSGKERERERVMYPLKAENSGKERTKYNEGEGVGEANSLGAGRNKNCDVYFTGLVVQTTSWKNVRHVYSPTSLIIHCMLRL